MTRLLGSSTNNSTFQSTLDPPDPIDDRTVGAACGGWAPCSDCKGCLGCEGSQALYVLPVAIVD